MHRKQGGTRYFRRNAELGLEDAAEITAVVRRVFGGTSSQLRASSCADGGGGGGRGRIGAPLIAQGPCQAKVDDLDGVPSKRARLVPAVRQRALEHDVIGLKVAMYGQMRVPVSLTRDLAAT